ncbi:MAG: DUF3450 domain-containing protein [Gammaproteobacteria bacterium]|jgi:hypothetical protein
MSKPKTLKPIFACLTGAVLVFGAVSSLAGPLETSIAIEQEMNKASQATQRTVDTLADQTLDMAQTYQLTLQSIDSIKRYNRSIEGYISRQEAEMDSIQTQMDGIDATERAVIPMMEDMIETLDQFVAMDMPFLKEERTERVKFLREMMLRADVSNSEKYRKILEAYQVENDYGTSVGAYEGTLEGEDKTVDFLRVGRVALVWQSRDEQSRAYWDNTSRSWVPLGDEYRKSISEGIKMARGQANLDLVKLPIQAASAR